MGVTAPHFPGVSNNIVAINGIPSTGSETRWWNAALMFVRFLVYAVPRDAPRSPRRDKKRRNCRVKAAKSENSGRRRLSDREDKVRRAQSVISDGLDMTV